MMTARLLSELAHRVTAGARCLHELGPRALALFLAQLGGDNAMLPGILATLETWRARLSRRRGRASGAGPLPPVAPPVPREGAP